MLLMWKDFMISNIPPSEYNFLQLLGIWINKNTGIDYLSNKTDILYLRLKSLCEELQIENIEELYNLLKNHDYISIGSKIIQNISINYTYFYREYETLKFFSEEILEQLKYNSEIKIWSSAVSSGEEAYTLAILSLEKLGLEKSLRSLIILGTDINPLLIKQAENGIYNYESIKHLPQNLIHKYFNPIGLQQYQVSEQLKKICIFRKLNMNTNPLPFSKKFDAIFCRNVLYYFDTKTQENIINSFFALTQTNGYLFTSVTETIKHLNSNWKTRVAGIHSKY